MEAIEKAKLALRNHLLNNKEKVAYDLEEMRKKSDGNDIFDYLSQLSSKRNLKTETKWKNTIEKQYSVI